MVRSLLSCTIIAWRCIFTIAESGTAYCLNSSPFNSNKRTCLYSLHDMSTLQNSSEKNSVGHMHTLRTLYPVRSGKPPPVAVAVIFPPPADGEAPVRSQLTSTSPFTLLHPPTECDIWASATHAPHLIPKPKGQVGCISRGGYSLRTVLGWSPALYSDVQARVYGSDILESLTLVHSEICSSPYPTLRE